jgi:hypothetical protein
MPPFGVPVHAHGVSPVIRGYDLRPPTSHLHHYRLAHCALCIGHWALNEHLHSNW